MRKVLTATLIISFLTLSMSLVYAQPAQRIPRGKRMFDRPQIRILTVLKANQEELKITDVQMEQIQNLVFSFREKSLKMQNENEMSRLELQKLMLDRENLDYDKIKAILSESSAARNEMFVDGLKLREEIENVLTPEQQEALREITRDGIRNRALDLRDRMLQRFPLMRNRIRR